jgi:hypothetical protein
VLYYGCFIQNPHGLSSHPVPARRREVDWASQLSARGIGTPREDSGMLRTRPEDCERLSPDRQEEELIAAGQHCSFLRAWPRRLIHLAAVSCYGNGILCPIWLAVSGCCWAAHTASCCKCVSVLGWLLQPAQLCASSVSLGRCERQPCLQSTRCPNRIPMQAVPTYMLGLAIWLQATQPRCATWATARPGASCCARWRRRRRQRRSSAA